MTNPEQAANLVIDNHPQERHVFSRVIAAGATLVGGFIGGDSVSANDQDKVSPSERICFDVEGEPGDVAVVNLTPVNASAPGNGQLISSDVQNPPVASNVNFGPNTVDPNVAFAPIGANGEVCYQNSEHASIDLIADHLGTIAKEAFTPASANGAPVRLMDNRISLGGPKLEMKEIRCLDVPTAYGDAAIMNITPVDATRLGYGQLISFDVKDNTPVGSNVNFGPGTVDPNVAIARTGKTTGAVCIENSPHGPVNFIGDYLGSVAAQYYAPASPDGGQKRVANTREGLGGAKVNPNGRICFTVAGEPGDVAAVNLTPVDADGWGNGQLISSDVQNPPVASNVNFGPNTVDPNVAFAPIGVDGKVCYQNSEHSSVNVIADHLGTFDGEIFEPATESGAPERRVDTRSGWLGQEVEVCDKVTWVESHPQGQYKYAVYDADTGQVVRYNAAGSPNIGSDIETDPSTCDNPAIVFSQIGPDGYHKLYRTTLATDTTTQISPGTGPGLNNVRDPDALLDQVCYVQYVSNQRNVRSTNPPENDRYCAGSFVEEFAISDTGSTVASIETYVQSGDPLAPIDNYVNISVRKIINGTAQMYDYEFTLGTGQRVKDVQVSSDGTRVFVMRSVDSGATYGLFELIEDPTVSNWQQTSGMHFLPVTLPSGLQAKDIHAYRLVGENELVALTIEGVNIRPVSINLSSQTIKNLSPAENPATGFYM